MKLYNYPPDGGGSFAVRVSASVRRTDLYSNKRCRLRPFTLYDPKILSQLPASYTDHLRAPLYTALRLSPWNPIVGQRRSRKRTGSEKNPHHSRPKRRLQLRSPQNDLSLQTLPFRFPLSVPRRIKIWLKTTRFPHRLFSSPLKRGAPRHTPFKYPTSIPRSSPTPTSSPHAKTVHIFLNACI